jgi:hypothetical protein
MSAVISRERISMLSRTGAQDFSKNEKNERRREEEKEREEKDREDKPAVAEELG